MGVTHGNAGDQGVVNTDDDGRCLGDVRGRVLDVDASNVEGPRSVDGSCARRLVSQERAKKATVHSYLARPRVVP